MSELVVYWIVYSIAFGGVTAVIASSKGRDGLGWFVIGFLLGILGVILIASLPSLIPMRVDLENHHPEKDSISHDQSYTTNSSVAADMYRKKDPISPVQPYDVKKWQVLKEVDPEIAASAKRVAEVSAGLEEELAEKYLTLNDKGYLALIERQLTEKFVEQEEKLAAQVAALSDAHASSSAQQIESYMALLAANDQRDPQEKYKVVGVEPYTGKWVMAQGGMKIKLENGEVVLVNGAFRRRLTAEAETF